MEQHAPPQWVTQAAFRYFDDLMSQANPIMAVALGGLLIFAAPVVLPFTLLADAALLFGRPVGAALPPRALRRGGPWLTRAGNPGWGLWVALLVVGVTLITLADLLRTRVLA